MFHMCASVLKWKMTSTEIVIYNCIALHQDYRFPWQQTAFLLCESTTELGQQECRCPGFESMKGIFGQKNIL